MKPIPKGRIDIKSMSQMPFITQPTHNICVLSVHEKINPEQLNFRVASIELVQQNHYLTKNTVKEGDNYRTTFGRYEIKKGYMLQLFYHNHWYGVVMGDPLEVLHTLFSKQKLDSKKAYNALKAARSAYEDDATLALYETLWFAHFKTAQQQKLVNSIRETYALYLQEQTAGSKSLYATQTRDKIKSFLTTYPNASYKKELLKLLKHLK